jgi:hypothetical protein
MPDFMKQEWILELAPDSSFESSVQTCASPPAARHLLPYLGKILSQLSCIRPLLTTSVETHILLQGDARNGKGCAASEY